jgi:type I restriction enzyme S subunit
MIELPFSTRKLKGSIIKINKRVKDLNLDIKTLKVYGVSNTEGVSITGKQFSEDISNYIYVSENQFVFNPYRVNVGSLGITSKGFSGLVSPAYEVFETTNDINSELLYFYLKSALGLKLIRWYGDRGGVRAALRFKELENLDFPNISKKKQEIVLNTIKLVSDKSIKYKTQLTKKIEHIAKFRQSILQEAFQGKLVPQDPNDEEASILLKNLIIERENYFNAELVRCVSKGIKKPQIQRGLKKNQKYNIIEDYVIPKTWVWTVVDKIAQVSIGGTPDRNNTNYWYGKCNWVSSGEVANNYIYTTKEKVTKEGLKNSNVRIYPKGTVLVAMIGQGKTRGQTSILEIEAGTNQNVAGLLINNEFIISKYLFYFFLSRYEKTRSKGRGGNQPALNGKIIGETSFPLPPYNEQKRIVEKVDKLMSLCDELEEKIIESQKNVDLLMQAVFQEAFASKKSSNMSH